jgi:hypothetical protein
VIFTEITDFGFRLDGFEIRETDTSVAVRETTFVCGGNNGD